MTYSMSQRNILMIILNLHKPNTMKTTLRELLEEEVNRIKERMNQLHKNIAEYSAAENYDAAAKNQIKYDTLFMVLRNLESILNRS